MAKKKVGVGSEDALKNEESKEEPKATAKTKKPKKVVPLLTFDRWFATTGRPVHHKAGMRAYLKLRGKRTKETWDRLFADY